MALALTVYLNRFHGGSHDTCPEDLGYVRILCLVRASTRATEESQLTEVPHIKRHKTAFLRALRGSEEEDENGRGSTNYDRPNDGIA